MAGIKMGKSTVGFNDPQAANALNSAISSLNSAISSGQLDASLSRLGTVSITVTVDSSVLGSGYTSGVATNNPTIHVSPDLDADGVAAAIQHEIDHIAAPNTTDGSSSGAIALGVYGLHDLISIAPTGAIPDGAFPNGVIPNGVTSDGKFIDFSYFTASQIQAELAFRIRDPLVANALGETPSTVEQQATDTLSAALQAKRAPAQCFLAGTPILMADGTEKPIEDIKSGDEVMAFDGRDSQGLGRLQPKKVTRLFRNVTKSIINLRGLKVTPGHRVLSDSGEWLTIAEVLRLDRGIVEERKTGAVLVRARTGAVIGSLDDTPIRVHFVDQKTGRQHYAIVRAGIPALAKYRTPSEAEIWTLGHVLLDEGYAISGDGWMTLPSGQRFNATPWPASSPFEAEMMLSWIISVDGVPYTPPWIADINEDEEQEAVNTGFSQPHSATSFRPTSSAPGRPLNRAERRRQQASFRVVK